MLHKQTNTEDSSMQTFSGEQKHQPTNFQSESKKEEKVIFICTAPSDEPKTGDVDYAQSLVSTLNVSGVKSFHLKDRRLSGEQIVEQVLQENQKNPVVFHLVMNGDDTFKVTTGGTIQLKHLDALKKAGVKIIITCLEYAKWSIAGQPSVVENWNKYFQAASRVCFVDENDKSSAIKNSQIIQDYAKTSRVEVIPIPTTIEKLKFDELKPINERENNYLCFGIIRPFKGIEKFALPLAKQFKEEKSTRKVLIVGSIPNDKHAAPELLEDMFLQAYGENNPNGKVNQSIKLIMMQDISKNTKVERLMDLYETTLKNLEPNINLEFHFNVEEEILPSLFNRCRYALNFNFKGVSPHFSGVTNTLMAHMKNYGLDLYLTPGYFKDGGKYNRLAKAFKVDYPEKATVANDEIRAIALNMLSDADELESNPRWPLEFETQLAALNKTNPMSIKTIATLFSAIYTQEIQEILPLLIDNFSPNEAKQITKAHRKLEFAFQSFNPCEPSSEKFRELATHLIESIDALRLNIETAIKNMIPMISVSHKIALRSTLLEKCIAPYFNAISSSENQKKMLEGVLANPSWLREIANRTMDHQIGFTKVVIINSGGYDLNMSEANVTTIKMPSVELRLHIYSSPNQKPLGEFLHSHGFDLFSKVSPRGVLVDQQFNLYENPVSKQAKLTADQLGVDIPEYDSEAQKLEKSLNASGVDYATPLQLKCLHARETYRFFGDQKEGYKIALYSPSTKTFTATPSQAIVAAGDSLRLHLSEKPHFVISAQGSHTYCLTLRRPGSRVGQQFKPSFLLVDPSDKGLSELDMTGITIKNPVPTISESKLEQLLTSFLQTLDAEIEYSNKLKLQTHQEALTYKMSNLLNVLLKISGSNVETDDFKMMMKPMTEPFLLRNKLLDKSLADPEVFIPIFCEELQKKISLLFLEIYGEKFDLACRRHIELLKATLTLVPYEEDHSTEHYSVPKSTCG